MVKVSDVVNARRVYAPTYVTVPPLADGATGVAELDAAEDALLPTAFVA